MSEDEVIYLVVHPDGALVFGTSDEDRAREAARDAGSLVVKAPIFADYRFAATEGE